MSTATMVKKTVSGLQRHGFVVIGDSYSDESIHGERVEIISKGPVVCNKKGRCADESQCIGAKGALFVRDPNYKPTGDEAPTGWRTGTLKICLTHLRNEHGAALLPDAPVVQTVVEKKVPRKKKTSDNADVAITTETLPAPAHAMVTWEALAHAAQSRNPEQLALLARQLKSENEMLVRSLLEAQRKVILALEG